jgi:hypothetical protein
MEWENLMKKELENFLLTSHRTNWLTTAMGETWNCALPNELLAWWMLGALESQYQVLFTKPYAVGGL